jgi:hypothetical protein
MTDLHKTKLSVYKSIIPKWFDVKLMNRIFRRLDR